MRNLLFGVTFPKPVDLSGGRTSLTYDLRTDPPLGTNAAIAVQYRPEHTWCQSTFTWLNQNHTGTAEVDLLDAMSCDVAGLTEVRQRWIYVNSGQRHLDHVRVE